MSDDASYMSFLNKANADPKAGQSSTTAESKSTSQDPSSQSLPPALQSLPDVTYTSDTDSPFEPVLFDYSGSSLPSAHEFKKVVSHTHHGKGGNEVEELSVGDFDARGEYKQIIQRVEQASKKGVKVYRVQVSSTKVEYYILTVGDKHLIGVVTKAVES